MEQNEKSPSIYVNVTRIYLILLIITQCLPAKILSQSSRDKQGYLNLYDNALTEEQNLPNSDSLTRLLRKLSQQLDAKSRDSGASRETVQSNLYSDRVSQASPQHALETDEDWTRTSSHPDLYRFLLDHIGKDENNREAGVAPPVSKDPSQTQKRTNPIIKALRDSDNAVSSMRSCYGIGASQEHVTVPLCRWNNPCAGKRVSYLNDVLNKNRFLRSGLDTLFLDGRTAALELDSYLMKSVIPLYKRFYRSHINILDKQKPCYMLDMPSSDPTRHSPLNSTAMLLDIDLRLTNVEVLLEIAKSAANKEFKEYENAPFQEVLRTLVDTYVVPMHCDIRKAESKLAIRPPTFVDCNHRFRVSANRASRHKYEYVLLHDFQNIVRQIVFTYDKLLSLT